MHSEERLTSAIYQNRGTTEKVFVRLDESGKHGFGAEGSKKEDRVIGLGLALQA